VEGIRIMHNLVELAVADSDVEQSVSAAAAAAGEHR
jgi:hypothetical protein